MTNAERVKLYKRQRTVSCVGMFLGAVLALIFIIDPVDICVFAYGAPVNVYAAFLSAIFVVINAITYSAASKSLKEYWKETGSEII